MSDRETTRAAFTIYDYSKKFDSLHEKYPVITVKKKGNSQGIYHRLFHHPNYAAPASIPIIRTIIIGLSGNMVSNQLITVSRQKDSWVFSIQRSMSSVTYKDLIFDHIFVREHRRGE
jgi:hypothetical protein